MSMHKNDYAGIDLISAYKKTGYEIIHFISRNSLNISFSNLPDGKRPHDHLQPLLKEV